MSGERLSYRSHVLFNDGTHRVPSARYKFVLLGSAGVGKTQFLIALTSPPNTKRDLIALTRSKPTIGVDFQILNIKIGPETGVSLTVWDTAGQERFMAIAPKYTRDAHAMFVLFDVTDRQSFVDVTHRWLPLVNEQRGDYDDSDDDNSDLLVMLVANKIDLQNERVVSNDEAMELAHQNRMYYVESSGAQVSLCQNIVKFAAQRVHSAQKDRTSSTETTNTVNLTHSDNSKLVVVHGKCCSK